GCELETWIDNVRLIAKVAELGALIHVFTLALQFRFVMVGRPLLQQENDRAQFVEASFPFLVVERQIDAEVVDWWPRTTLCVRTHVSSSHVSDQRSPRKMHTDL